ncbi:ExbD/TolR family protein [Erythrobacter crassostreae]|uniref:Biopolymer transporter ExbD n=1 Tax=Erythrobacter crassostreae TaxID=2828328 RepID=A0A9X1F326_9SPHN|nr:biopolymer transporter ExbD [Erythrobacter crassostrea]MBV7258438.1 biopolymer transporter ExbD [Erythrobacter crassostrea]
MKRLKLSHFQRSGMLALGLAIPLGLTGCNAPLTQSGISEPTINHDRNLLEIGADDTLRWNGVLFPLGSLPDLLKQTTELAKEPELEFRPAANASYDLSAQVIGAIRESGVAKFGFVGNEKYRVTDPSND